MNKYTIESKYNKQIEECKRFITVLKTALKVLEKFDGRLINVRIERALKEALKDMDLSIKVDHSTRELDVADYRNNTYIVYNSDGSRTRYGHDKIDYTSMEINLSEDDDKVDMEIVRKNIDAEIQFWNQLIEKYQGLLLQYDDFEKDYKLIEESIRNFNKKYSGTLRCDCGYNFSRIY